MLCFRAIMTYVMYRFSYIILLFWVCKRQTVFNVFFLLWLFILRQKLNFQTSLGSCPQCCILSSRAIGPLVPKTILKGFFTIYGRSGHLYHMNQKRRTNFRSPYPPRLYMKFGFDWPTGFGGKDVWRVWTTDGRRADDGACLYYKLTYEPKGSGELKWNNSTPTSSFDSWCRPS